ncbi:hypothetical protein cypCar_00034813 [Cyprinus carpio]|nr:hypothetical protein cypCar_00034813 [Cyprinus carpio]
MKGDLRYGKEEPLDEYPEPTDLKIESSPPPLHDISTQHSNDDQTEPVDLSLNKPRPSLPVATATSTPANPPPHNITASATIPAVLSPGSILASTQGVGGQQILHVIHTIPSVNMPSKMGQLQTIPVVVQSLPVVYTTVPTDGVATAAITVPLIGSDGRSEGSVRIKPGSTSPVEYQSESDAESGTESGSASFSTQGMEPSIVVAAAAMSYRRCVFHCESENTLFDLPKEDDICSIMPGADPCWSLRKYINFALWIARSD